MALKISSRPRPWARLWFAVRFVGITGLLAAGIGLVLASQEVDLSSWQTVRALVEHPQTSPLTPVTQGLLAVGAGLALLALLIEILSVSRRAAGRRSAFGLNVVIQTALAVVLLACINAYSYWHYYRFDFTRQDPDGNRVFTLPAEIRDNLKKLDGQTTIVVYQRHKTFGQALGKPDAYDYAAERKVVEKVKDLVEQFREFGPRFRVVILDVEEEGFNEKLAELTATAPELKEALDSATENSIFFHAAGAVQRLGFHDIYELDKQGSQEANGGKGNLVLLYQGVGPFARKVLNIDEKRPRIGMAVVHEVLSLESTSEDLGMNGVKKTLAAHGFDSRDLILKKWSEITGPEPGVFTFDESKYERLEEQLEELDAGVKTLETDRMELKDLVKLWKTASLDDLTKKYAEQLNGQKITEALRRRQLAVIEQNLAIREFLLSQQREDRDAVAKEKAGLNVESIHEQRRIADLKAKAERTFADCDMLVIPRLTLFNVARGELIPNRVYKLDDAQVAAIKDFIKAGKPVLFLFGPSNEPANRMEPPALDADKMEEMVAELGIKMPKQTILYSVESKSFAERRGGLVVLGANVEVPPVEFSWPEGSGLPLALSAREADLKLNPIRESMYLTARGLSKDQTLDLRLRHPRPIYYEPPRGAKLTFQPEFMMTTSASWNDDQPFPTRERTPRFEPPKANDPASGTVAEKRRGPFPIGVAVETVVPETWLDGQKTAPPPVRVAAIGHGGIFTGTTLSPVKEKLLLDTCNWLLGRDDLLTKAEHQWQYPRVALSDSDSVLWQWGARLGLPVFFGYLGLVVLMVRRLR